MWWLKVRWLKVRGRFTIRLRISIRIRIRIQRSEGCLIHTGGMRFELWGFERGSMICRFCCLPSCLVGWNGVKNVKIVAMKNATPQDFEWDFEWDL